MRQNKQLIIIIFFFIFTIFFIVNKISEINANQEKLNQVFTKINLLTQINKKSENKNAIFINELDNILSTNLIPHQINKENNSFYIFIQHKNSKQVLEIFEDFLEKNPFSINKLNLYPNKEVYNIELFLN
jgi:nitrate reductase NapAB chaperone NapD